MFGKLKDKLKDWVKKVSYVEEIEEEIIEKPKKETKKKSEKKEKKISKKEIKKSTKKTEKIIEEKSEELSEDIDLKLKEEVEKEKYIEPARDFQDETEPKTLIPPQAKQSIPDAEKTIERLEEIKEEKKKEKTETKSFFKKLISKTKSISSEEFNDYAEDLEMILLENNVALEVAEKIIEELKGRIVGLELTKKEIEETIIESLKEIIEKVLIEPFDLIKEIKNKKEPYIILFCGINGTGKTTHIAKVANMLKEKGITSVLAAGDTFRAAAVEQLKKHGEKLDIKVIAQDYGTDPAAVGFDAIKYAKKNNINVVLIDTAGRIHTATNLIREMAKIKKVCNPDRTIFVGESITGNDATDQVKAFNDNIGIDGIILSKADIDEKGGTALSVGYTTNKPILYLGTGQGYGDLEKFDKKKFIEKLGFDEV
jgi:fused signal recognition particle receptor